MFCGHVKEFLSANEVPFEDHDVSQDEKALAELQKLGLMTTPVTVVDGEAVVGFNKEKLSSLLNIK